MARNSHGKKDKWWTGQTCFPLIEVDPEEFRMALAARKGPPKRSKAEAKREAKQSKFHGTETIQLMTVRATKVWSLLATAFLESDFMRSDVQ